jgi:RNA polymerase sigma-70 factor (sigma-E family)
MASAPRRDTQEFCEFVTSRSSALFRVAYMILGDYQLAQDLVQESLAKTYVAWPRLHDVANAEAYTRRVIATTAISWRRRRGFHELPSEHLPERVGTDPAAAMVVHDALWTCLLELPPRQRAAIVLRYYVDLSEAQTAETMGCSVGAVKSSASAGMSRLRQRIGPDLLPSDDQAVHP